MKHQNVLFTNCITCLRKTVQTYKKVKADSFSLKSTDSPLETRAMTATAMAVLYYLVLYP